METTFRWRSWLGASVIFFLIFGVINVGLAIAVPATLHLSGSFPGVVFGAGDAHLLGRSFAALRLQPPASWLRYTIGDWRPWACAIGLATLEMGCACSIGSGIKRAANPFGSVCEPSRSRLTSYWTWCCTGKVTRASVEREVWL
jgi:hypothetical protein